MWEKQFRADARDDNYLFFFNHLSKLGLPDKPKKMLEGTIHMVRACCAYNSFESSGKLFDKFLAAQTYFPDKKRGSRYSFTFDICGKAYPRILVNDKFEGLDLADMFDFPWDAYKLAGFCHIWIAKIDWSALKKTEVKRLEQAVEDDLFYDFTEDEVGVYGNDSIDSRYLFVTVYNIDPDLTL